MLLGEGNLLLLLEPTQPCHHREKKLPGRAGMRIVDDDVSWNCIAAVPEKEEEDKGDVPVVAEFIAECPNELKLMEEFRTNSKWKVLEDKDLQSLDILGPAKSTTRRWRHDSPEPSPPAGKHNGSLDLCPLRWQHHDTPDPSPPQRQRHDTSDPSPPRRQHHDMPDLSRPKRQHCDTPDLSPPRGQQRHDTPDSSPPRRQRHDTPDPSPPRRWHHDMPDLSAPRWQCQDLSPRREKLESLSGKKSQTKGRTLPAQKDQRRSRGPPEHPLHRRDAKGSPKKANMMSSRVKAGLVSANVLQRVEQELWKHERSTKHLEEESQNTQTVFRDKSGCKRNLAQEQLEERLKGEAESRRKEQYAKWGKGLAQERQQQEKVEDAVKEMQKPLARYIDDQNLDRMLREQEREGDPMAALIKKRKAKENKEKEKPRYKGPAPSLNRFNIWPRHRWDSVDRSNGFEQQRFSRIANKKAVQELAYKCSVKDM